MIDRIEGIREFLTHLVKLKILRKNKYVINFFPKITREMLNLPKIIIFQKIIMNQMMMIYMIQI